MSPFIFKIPPHFSLTDQRYSFFFSCHTRFFDDLAGMLPNPAFYWPLALYPLTGSAVVSVLTLLRGPGIKVGIETTAANLESQSHHASADIAVFDPMNQLVRLLASVFTLGSGISLGPEGPCVEIGTGISRLVTGASEYTEADERNITTVDKGLLALIFASCSQEEKSQVLKFNPQSSIFIDYIRTLG